MDNRLKFLYRDITELWGHGVLTEAGKGKTGASTGGEIQAKPYLNPMVLRGANKSSEAHGPSVEKSRYCVYRTRTVNRHRWMRRES